MTNNCDFKSDISREYKKTLEYHDYPKPYKLEAIFLFWLTSFFFITNIGKHSPKKILNLHLWYLNSINLDLHKKKMKPKTNIKRKLISIFPFINFFNFGILPGGQKIKQNLLEKILFISLNSRLVSIDASININLRNDFFERISNIVDHDTFKKLVDSMPDFFFTKIIKSKLPSSYSGSMAIIFETPYNKIFFQNPAPEIIGYAHGGYYGEFLGNKFEALEKIVADKYFGWGLSEENIIQNRFLINKPINKKIKSIFLVGSPPINPLINSYFSGLDIISSEADYFTKRILNDGNINFTYLAHPSIDKKNTKLDFDNQSSFNELTKVELDTGLYIIDRPGHTVLYKCIYEALPFILIYNDEWKGFFTPKFLQLLKLLESQGLLFWYSQKSDFLKDITSYNNGKIFHKHLFTQLRNFLERG